MTQILVTGMHRSGTTLIMDLMSRHPAVATKFNEAVLLSQKTGGLVEGTVVDHRLIQSQGVLKRAKNEEAVEVNSEVNLKTATYVSKMSYPGPIILQEWQGRTDRYVRCWLSELGESARVIHVVRHPFSVFASMRERWAGDPIHHANYGPLSLDTVCRDWVAAVEAVLGITDLDPRCTTVVYERFVEEPERHLAGLYELCGLHRPDVEARAALAQDIVFFGKVSSERKSRHRREELEAISRAVSWLTSPLMDRFGFRDL